ncbi:MAG: topoisomerase C-terminal repeat-containing protein, partial [Flavobacteriaceae bacterium]|nr:topoisomerase C-terminal repeat-containing protein [Flavobacteriaceae bacterium]
RKYKVFKLQDKKLDKKSLTENYGSNKGKLIPTDVGMVVNDFLVEHFKNILDYDFTAKVEADFDDIASGEKQWTQIMKQFYDGFHPVVKDVAENAEREVGERILGKDPESGKVISVKLAKYGPVVQRGATESEEKPEFAGLAPGQSIDTVTLEDALDLFKLPRQLGDYEGENIEVNNGRYGPYVKYGKKFISIPQGEDLFKISLDRAVELIKEREAADAPIYTYKGKPVTKGKGRFGPYIKYDNTFINVNKKYDFDHLSPEDIESLIEDKIKKDKEKIIQRWDDEDIQVEKGRWGRLYAVKGKKRVELDRKIKPEEVSLDMVKALFKAPAKKAPAKTKRSKKSS